MIRECGAGQNVYVTFHGKKRISTTEVRREFNIYGYIKSIRIKKDWNGEDTKSAMICFSAPKEASSALEGMKDSSNWEVGLYRTRGVYRQGTEATSMNNFKEMIPPKVNQYQQGFTQHGQHWSIQDSSFFQRHNNSFFQRQKRNIASNRDEDFPSLPKVQEVTHNHTRSEFDELKEEVRNIGIEMKELVKMIKHQV